MNYYSVSPTGFRGTPALHKTSLGLAQEIVGKNT